MTAKKKAAKKTTAKAPLASDAGAAVTRTLKICKNCGSGTVYESRCRACGGPLTDEASARKALAASSSGKATAKPKKKKKSPPRKKAPAASSTTPAAPAKKTEDPK